MADTMAAYDKVTQAQVDVIKAQDQGRINFLLKDRSDNSAKFREKFWSERGVKVDGRTSTERYVDNRQSMDEWAFGKARYSGDDAAARYREDEETRAWMNERYESAKSAPVTKRVAVDFNFGGRQRTITTEDEADVDGLLRDLKFANRGY